MGTFIVISDEYVYLPEFLEAWESVTTGRRRFYFVNCTVDCAGMSSSEVAERLGIDEAVVTRKPKPAEPSTGVMNATAIN